MHQHQHQHQPKKDDGSNVGPNVGSSLFSLPPHSSHLFASQHHAASIFSNAVTSQQQADFLSAISSGLHLTILI
jgi:hypothetical protein